MKVVPRRGQLEITRPARSDGIERRNGELRPNAAVNGGRAIEQRDEALAESIASHLDEARSQAGADFIAVLEASIRPPLANGPLSSDDVADLVALLSSSENPANPAFAQAAAILGQLKRLMEVVESRRLGMLRGGSGKRRVEAIADRQGQSRRSTPQEPDTRKSGR